MSILVSTKMRHEMLFDRRESTLEALEIYGVRREKDNRSLLSTSQSQNASKETTDK